MVWLKTFKLSALGRQPEDVEYCILWGCLATSPLRYRRIQEMFMNRSDYRICITTNTADLLIRLCLVLILCTFVYIHV
ncbi:hypothetical protein Hanom_Chr01g00025691 [Helianthus anomalus]